MDIQLRNLKLQDLEQMVLWEENKDPLFSDYSFPRYNKREQRIWYNSKTRYGKICLAIIDEEKVVGYIAIRKLNPIAKSGEMGIIIRPSYQNMGVGQAAISKMLAWFFGDFGYKKMTLYVGMYNKRAMKCYDKLGFVPVKDSYLSFDNHDVDIDDPKYKDIAKYFKVKNGKMETLCVQMSVEKNNKK